jgi:hypothetical protein
LAQEGEDDDDNDEDDEDGEDVEMGGGESRTLQQQMRFKSILRNLLWFSL